MTNLDFDKAKKNFEEGVIFFQAERFKLAEQLFLSSLKLLPNRISTINNLIKLYVKTNQSKKLSEILNKHDHLKDNKEMLFGLAYKYYYERKIDDSKKICSQLINHEDLKSSIEDLMALNFKEEKNYLKSLNIYKKKVKNDKENFINFYNIGCLFFDLGRINQAYFFFKKSNKLNPKDNRTLLNLSLCKLSLKDFKKGFELFEYRWKKNEIEKKKFQYIASPKNIDQVVNKRILIWDEQGLGDTINFSRFAIDLLKFTSKITLVVNKKLKDILINLHPKILVIDYDNLKQQKFDFQSSICSLPKLLRISSEKDINYFKLSLENKTQKSKSIKKDFNIGIACSGNPNFAFDRYRSIAFENFKELLKFKNINFFKLSQNTKDNELIDYNSFPNLLDYSEKSLFEVANLMQHLDLVISSDTSMIHLAGILNIKSILLLNFNSDWRWFNERKKTVWYPSVKIIKQEKFDNWKTVFDNLNNEIKELIK